MTKRGLFASTMLTCFVGGFLQTAQAEEPEQSFFPKNKWVVEQVSSSTSPTCTISNQLNNGYIVQLAGTSNGFTNLNLDLRQDVFQDGLNYEVKYSIPGKLDTVIPTKAFRENLLVSDLRQEKTFADSLPVSSVVDVSIRGNEFRIYLTGLAAVMPDYYTCLGIDIAAVKTARERDVQAKAMLSTEPETANSDLAPPPPVYISTTEAIDETGYVSKAPLPAHKLRPASSSAPRYTEQLAKRLKEESNQYKPNSGDMTPGNIKAHDIVATAEPMTQSDTISTASSSMAATLNTHSEKKNGAIYNIETLSAPAVKDMTSMGTVSKIEPASALKGAGGDFTMMRDQILALEDQVNVLSRKNKMLDDELKSSLADSRNERLSVSSNNWNLEAATMKFNEAERQIMRLGRQLKTQRAQCDAEKSQLENMLFDPQVTDQQQLAKLASLEADLERATSDLYRQQRQYEERIKILEGRLNAQ